MICDDIVIVENYVWKTKIHKEFVYLIHSNMVVVKTPETAVTK